MSPLPIKNHHHKQPVKLSFEDEINRDPSAHFLSPVQMYEYEDWAEDSDDAADDDDDIQWDAGITDFSLFHHDRRRAQEQRQHVPDRWEGLLVNQASALQRAVQRNRSDLDTTRTRMRAPQLNDVPHLTPDNSPNLREFDIDAYCGAKANRSAVPIYLQRLETPQEEMSDEYDDDDDDYDDDDDLSDSDEDELPIAFLVERARERRRQARKLERPGLRFNRTMSGKVHVWRRPSWHLHDVGEDVEAESRAEREQHTRSEVEHDSQRGRRR
jgi:hypothetical protein